MIGQTFAHQIIYHHLNKVATPQGLLRLFTHEAAIYRFVSLNSCQTSRRWSEKTSFPTRKASSDLCSYFNVKMPRVMIKLPPSRLISVAAAVRLAATAFLLRLLPWTLSGSLQRSLCAFVTNQRKLTGFSIMRSAGFRLHDLQNVWDI